MKTRKLSLFILLLVVLSGFILSEAAQAAITYGKTSPKKGAGGAGDRPPQVSRALGISWSYSWWVAPECFNAVYEYVPMLKKGMNLTNIQNVAKKYPGRYWLVFNEPDFYYSDNISATDGAIFYKQAREAIKQVDPTAKFIVGGVYYEGLGWLTQFRNEYKRLYGVYPSVEGWHAHLYVGGDYNKDTWRQKITYWKTWMTNNGGIKEFWLTEFGCLQSDGVSLQIMQDQVPWLESTATWITRYAWYAVWVPFKDNPYCNQCRTSLTNEDGSFTPLGQLFSTFGQPFTPPTYTITATATAGGTISPTGAIPVQEGGSQTFTVTPNPGFNISDVKVNGISKGALTSQAFNNVFSNQTIEATFAAGNGFTLPTSKTGTGNGTVTSNPAGPVFSAGTVVTITATPDNSSLFAGWSGGCSGISPTCQVTMNANASVTATFTVKPATYAITATAGANGSISPQGAIPVNAGESKTFSVTPNPGYTIADVKVDAISQGQYSTYNFSNITSNHTIQATFRAVSPNLYTLTVSKTGTGLGSISQNPSGSVFNAGTVVTLTAVPGAKSTFEGWLGACTGTSSACQLTMSSNRVVMATFKEASASTEGRGIFDMNGDGKPDILWHHQQRGDVYVWFMDGATFLRDQHIRTINDDLNWKVVGVGDFNGDGKPDILWHHQQRGDVYVWFMDGAKFLYEKYIRTVPEIEWQIEAVGDYNEDGKPDILWRNQRTGEVYVWFMDGATFVRDWLIRIVEDAGWKIVN